MSQSARFSKPKLSQTEFTIAHYAGPVTYRTDNFLDKNKDFVVAEQQELLGNSAYAFVQALFPADTAAEDGKVCSVMPFGSDAFWFSCLLVLMPS